MPELRFRVISTHPTINSAELVYQLLDHIPDLNKSLRDKWTEIPDLSLEADREQSIPIEPATAYLVLKFVGATIAAGFLEQLGEDAYNFLKERIKNGAIDPPEDT